MSTGTAPLRVLVCGTNFGRFYAQAVDERPGLVLAGVLSRGSAASRELAARYGVPHHTEVSALPEDIDLACVAVGSAISGGAGTELALALLDRGVHVLQEHPVHLDEMTRCLRLARRRGVHYRVNTHYPHVAPVRRFLAAAQRLRERQRPLFVDAAGPVHLMHPLVDVLGRALGSLRPWSFDEGPTRPGAPFQTVSGALAGIPLTLRVQNQLDPSDRDNHALHWHRVSLGTEGGVLTLADTHGPVLWSPRLHVARDTGHRFVLDGPGTEPLERATTSVLGGTGSFREVFTRLWPDALGLAIDGLREAAEQGTDPLAGAQYDLTVCRIWSALAARIGPPELVRPPTPRPLTADELFPEEAGPGPVTARPRAPRSGRSPRGARPVGGAEPGAGADGAVPGPTGTTASGPPSPAPSGTTVARTVPYDTSAEFFNLVAAEHTETASAPAVAELLADADLSYGPVADIGAGTGLLTEAVARARPDVEVFACEPATGMRAVLMSRVVSDPHLRARVTVTDDRAPELDLPDRLGAVLLCGVLGHLDTEQRALLWRYLRPRLGPASPVVVELMGLEEPVELPQTRTATARAGRHTYAWWFSGGPDPEEPRAMRLRSTWRVHEDGAADPVREVRDSYRWWPFGLRAVEEESGLCARLLATRPGAPPLAVLSRPPGTGSVSTPGPLASGRPVAEPPDSEPPHPGPLTPDSEDHR
ncbi:Gfo/Idh/MocA family oxidoreductase [Streptomyces sp. NPDC088923]|uniref:Gfo/Idh/MocA family oxidoreductase n=1 Tax=Streptomyces sp. NPDC088923 TaxID=3365913 RepID=UPI00380868C1